MAALESAYAAACRALDPALAAALRRPGGRAARPRPARGPAAPLGRRATAPASTSPTSSSSTSHRRATISGPGSPRVLGREQVHELARDALRVRHDRPARALARAPLPAAKRDGADGADADPVAAATAAAAVDGLHAAAMRCTRSTRSRRSSCACTAPAITTARPECPFAWRVPGRPGSRRRDAGRGGPDDLDAARRSPEGGARSRRRFVTDPARIGGDAPGHVLQQLSPAEIVELLFDVIAWSQQKVLVALRSTPRSTRRVDPARLRRGRARRRRWRLEAKRLRSRTHHRGDAAAARGCGGRGRHSTIGSA